jgi:hypothetical protein
VSSKQLAGARVHTRQPIFKFSNFQIFKFPNPQILKSSNSQILKFPNSQIMTQPPHRTRRLRLLKGLGNRTLSADALFSDFKIKKFNFFGEVPGYIEDASFVPVSGKEFFDYARAWPVDKIKMKLTDTPKETVLKTIRKKLESEEENNFRFLWELVPEEMQVQWEAERKELQKQKEAAEEEARLEQERIDLQWANLHPLNQEWGIPPPPAVTKSKTDQRLDEWVYRYQPYMYVCNGRFYRKKTTGRYDNMYEVSDVNQETVNSGQGSEKETERERGKTETEQSAFSKATADEKRERGEKQPEDKAGTEAACRGANTETERERERGEKETPEQRKKREKAERDAKFEIEYRKNHPLPPEPEEKPQREPLYATRVINPGSDDARIRKIAEAMRRLKT